MPGNDDCAQQKISLKYLLTVNLAGAISCGMNNESPIVRLQRTGLPVFGLLVVLLDPVGKSGG